MVAALLAASALLLFEPPMHNVTGKALAHEA